MTAAEKNSNGSNNQPNGLFYWASWVQGPQKPMQQLNKNDTAAKKSDTAAKHKNHDSSSKNNESSNDQLSHLIFTYSVSHMVVHALHNRSLGSNIPFASFSPRNSMPHLFENGYS